MARNSFKKELRRATKTAIHYEKRQFRKEQRDAKKEVIRARAASIVNGQPLISDFRIMDETAEEVLKRLLKLKKEDTYKLEFSREDFPEYIKMSLRLELEKLTQYGMIGGVFYFDNGGIANLLPPAFSYFENKDEAFEKQKEYENREMKTINNYGNYVEGNVINSSLSVDNSIIKLEKEIEEKGGEDKEELMDILEEVKELIENMNSLRTIPKQKKLFQRISDHFEKHGWFYGAVVQLLGTAAFKLLEG